MINNFPLTRLFTEKSKDGSTRHLFRNRLEAKRLADVKAK